MRLLRGFVVCRDRYICLHRISQSFSEVDVTLGIAWIDHVNDYRQLN
jgi:hypothetical protein